MMIADVVVASVVLVAIATSKYGTKLRPDMLKQVTDTPIGFLSTGACSMIIITLAALSGAGLSPVPWKQRLRFLQGKFGALNFVAGTTAILGVGLMLSALEGLGVVPQSPVLTDIDHFMAGLHWPAMSATVFIMGIMPGIAEELLFRGYIQTRFTERWGARWAILWTALLFGVMHLDLIQGSYALAVGLLLGYMTERTGSVIPAMVCHAANNTITTLLTGIGPDFVTRRANLMALAIGLVIVAAATLHLRARLTPAKASVAA